MKSGSHSKVIARHCHAFFLCHLDIQGSDFDSTLKTARQEHGSTFLDTTQSTFVDTLNKPALELLSFDALDAFHQRLNWKQTKENSRHWGPCNFKLTRWSIGREGLKDLITEMHEGREDCYIEVINNTFKQRFCIDECNVGINNYYTGNSEGLVFLTSLENRIKMATNPFLQNRAEIYFNVFCEVQDKIPKIQKALETLKSQLNPFLNAKAPLSDANKDNVITSIGQTMRQIAQTRLYGSGTALLLHLYSNILLHKCGITPFYPETPYLFDGHSNQEILKRVQAGQTRFIDLFTSMEKLVEQFDSQYVATLTQRIKTLQFRAKAPIEQGHYKPPKPKKPGFHP